MFRFHSLISNYRGIPQTFPAIAEHEPERLNEMFVRQWRLKIRRCSVFTIRIMHSLWRNLRLRSCIRIETHGSC